MVNICALLWLTSQINVTSVQHVRKQSAKFLAAKKKNFFPVLIRSSGELASVTCQFSVAYLL